MTEPLYLALLAAFATHELDAVLRREWRIFPILRRLPEVWAAQIFLWAHVPLFLAVFWLSGSEGFRKGLAAFAILHVGLHWLLRRHPACGFNNPSSQALIWLTGVLGGLVLFTTPS